MSAITIDARAIGGAPAVIAPCGNGGRGRGVRGLGARGLGVRSGGVRARRENATEKGRDRSVRLTRAGRLAVTLTVALVAVVAAAVAFAASGGASAGQQGQVITIRSGQTLSELAVTYLPEQPIGEGVAAIQRANQLQNDRIIAGQELVIPRG